LLFAAVMFCSCPPAFSEIIQQQAYAPAQTPAPTTTQTTTLPAQSQSEGIGAAAGHGGQVAADQYDREAQTDFDHRRDIAYPQVVTPTQILVHGKAPGEVSLLIWDELERSRSFDLRVDVDVSACAEEERRVFPTSRFHRHARRALAIVLSGHVSTEDVSKRAGELASAYSPKVVNVLTFGPVGAQEVLLQVKFAEVDRTALTQMGVNFISTGAA
jgi:Flp pilus assembly secretin CpaC